MRSILLVMLGLVEAAPFALAAQQASGRASPGIAKGVSIDRFIYEGTGATAVTYRASTLTPDPVGTELGISLFPDALRANALILAPDFGAGYNLRLGSARLLLKAGGSAILGLGQGFAFYPGFHLGGGVILEVDDRSGLRVDLIRHYYRIDAETRPIWSIGLGVTGLPRRAK